MSSCHLYLNQFFFLFLLRIIDSFFSSEIPRPFSVKLLSSQLASQPVLVTWIILAQVWDLVFFSVVVHEMPVPFLQLVKFTLNGSTTILWWHFSQFCIIFKCRNSTLSFICTINEGVKSIGPTVSPWSMLLVSGIQMHFVILTMSLLAQHFSFQSIFKLKHFKSK